MYLNKKRSLNYDPLIMFFMEKISIISRTETERANASITFIQKETSTTIS